MKMDTATASTPEPPRRLAVSPPSPGRRRGAWIRPSRTVAGAICTGRCCGCCWRSRWGCACGAIKQGLPYSYNSDEATHFVPRAIAFFSHDYNPQYFLNPPAYSYLLHFVFELWFGSPDAVRRAYVTDPTEVFVVARVVAAVLGTVAVWLTYLAGERLFDRTVALLGAAIFGLAFLPIFYSHLALNDVPTLAPVALSLYGMAGVLRNGARRDYVIAGIGIGLAAATKYTGGITVVCLVAAAVCDGAGGAPLTALRRLALALGCAVLAFVAANPYSVLDFSAFHAGVTTQQALAGGSDPDKLGTTAASGTAFYLWTFTWGLGWAPSIAALAGSVLLLVRRRLALALVLLPAPIAFIVFMGDQQRFFGRWLMPIFPIVALLAAYGAVEAARWLIRDPRDAGGARRRRGRRGDAGPEPGRGHPQRRRALPGRHPQRDPGLDGAPRARRRQGGGRAGRLQRLGQDIGRSLPWTPSGARWQLWNPTSPTSTPTATTCPWASTAIVVVDEYERTLRPELLQEYANSGYCWVVIGSLQAGRSFAQPKIAPAAIAYYAALANQAR